jgi:hypothetical protein
MNLNPSKNLSFNRLFVTYEYHINMCQNYGDSENFVQIAGIQTPKNRAIKPFKNTFIISYFATLLSYFYSMLIK